MRVSTTTFFVVLAYIATVKGDDPTTNCPRYVDDGSNLNCTCLPPAGVTQATLNWRDHSDTPQLVIGNVRRQDNGTQYVCQMVVNGQTTTTTYTLRVAYGPSADTLHITGQSPFPTDGSRSLTLTCEDKETNPPPTYTWEDGLCDGGKSGSTCTFTPDVPGDEGKNVKCTALNTDTSVPTTATQTFTVILAYPPPDPPVISGFQNGQILKSGDNISCTVNGGKPTVTSIDFTCKTPTHVGSQDGVTSTITVDTSQASEDNMTCSCTAKWAPDTTLYTNNTQVSIPLQYRATVQNFTINSTSGSLTVNERDNVTVIFTCNARGRPAPSVTIQKANGELLNEVGNTPSDEHDKTVSSTLVGVTCEDMARYHCNADNNITNPDGSNVQLNVRTAPKGRNSTTTKETPKLLSKTGLSFTVCAYPVPDKFNFTFYDKKTNQTEESSVPSGTFKVTSIVEDPSLPVVICSIKPLDVPHDRLGVYRVEVSNGLEGTYKYFFEVRETVIRSKDVGPFPAWLIVVIILIILLFLVGICVTLVYVFKRKGKKVMPWCKKKDADSKDVENSSGDKSWKKTGKTNANHNEKQETVPKKGRLPPLESTPRSQDESPKKRKKPKSPKKKKLKREKGPRGDEYTLVVKGTKGDNTSSGKRKNSEKDFAVSSGTTSDCHGQNFAASSNYSDVEPYASASLVPGHDKVVLPAINRISMESGGYATVETPADSGRPSRQW